MPQESATSHIARLLREKIERGELAPGALLPSEPELAGQHDVSRETARRALQLLEAEGLVEVQRRRGRKVRRREPRVRVRLSDYEHPESTASSSTDAWDTDLADQGVAPSFQDFKVRRVIPPPWVAEILGIPEAEQRCICRERTHLADGKPIAIGRDYFDFRIVHGTELAWEEDTQREDILKEAGYEQTYDVDRITTRMPDADEVKTLRLSTAMPVLELVRVGYTPQGKAVRASSKILHGDKIALEYITAT